MGDPPQKSQNLKNTEADQLRILDSNPKKLQMHFTSLKKENLNLPTLMKIRNTAMFREYKRIIKPLKHHQKITRNLTNFLKSSYRKTTIQRRSDLSDLKSSEYGSVWGERSILVTNPSDRSLTPMKFGAWNKPILRDPSNSRLTIKEKRVMYDKFRSKIKNLCQTSQSQKAQNDLEF